MRLKPQSVFSCAGYRALLGGVVLALIAGVILLGSGTVYAQLTGVHTTPATERYTELMFNNLLQLPHIPTGEKQYVTFRIQNHEGRRVTYRYQLISTRPDGAAAVLNSGRTAIDDGAAANIRLPFLLPSDSPLTKLTVVLPDQRQEIHLWAAPAK